MRNLVLITALGMAIAGCSSDPNAPRYVWVADGQPVNCINSNQIRGFNVVNDRTIDFEMTGNRRFRNEMPMSCQDLSFGMRIRINNRGTSQLCRGDTISVAGPAASTSPFSRNCPLGQFQPLARVQVPAPPAG